MTDSAPTADTSTETVCETQDNQQEKTKKNQPHGAAMQLVGNVLQQRPRFDAESLCELFERSHVKASERVAVLYMREDANGGGVADARPLSELKSICDARPLERAREVPAYRHGSTLAYNHLLRNDYTLAYTTVILLQGIRMSRGPDTKPRKRTPMAERFWAAVEKSEGCWIWVGFFHGSRYGSLYEGNTRILAHRFSWMLHNGAIPANGVICHRCDNPSCVRPDHLFLGTMLDNARDMTAKGRHANQKKAHCKYGHEFTAENTYLKKGVRCCRTCIASTMKKYRNRISLRTPR